MGKLARHLEDILAEPSTQLGGIGPSFRGLSPAAHNLIHIVLEIHARWTPAGSMREFRSNPATVHSQIEIRTGVFGPRNPIVGRNNFAVLLQVAFGEPESFLILVDPVCKPPTNA